MGDGRPRVGITRCSTLDDYMESVRRAGGDPVVLDWAAGDAAGALREIDALVLTGGPDVDPKHYRDPARHPETRTAEPGRDRFELDLARRAAAQDVPVLAICRGMQVLNVAAGGTLLQDIPSQRPGALPHDIKTPKNAVAHPVAIQPHTALARLLGAPEARVNSRHHQAVKTTGDGLVVTAVAPDGVIEAVERAGARFCVGVEWHPENFVDTGEFLPLFRGLVEAARK